jgi:dipeptidyl aminopeptidase/acylaminoacyl peptidase
MSADGSRQKRLTHEKGDPSTPEGLFFQVEPAWSPEGRQIAFASRRDGPFHIFVMRADGSGTHRLTSTKADDENPTWSPDGSEIAFERGPAGDIYLMDADGTRTRRVGKDFADEGDPAWSPDGRWIAYSRRTPGTSAREIWLVHPNGSGRRQLTHLQALSQAPAWSFDGRRIAFSSDKDGGIFGIYSVGVDGKTVALLAKSETGAFEPAWSMDGKTVVFSSDGSIVTVDLGGREKELTHSKNDSSPAWRPVQPQ